MLKLSLRPGDSITIGEDISVKLGENTISNAHLIIDAPLEYDIRRHKKAVKESKIYIVNSK